MPHYGSIYTRLTIIALLVTWLMAGIRQNDEFSEIDLFLKYRPTTQVWFHSPLGMQDMPPGYPQYLVEKEYNYDDFVHGRHWSNQVTGIVLLLIQFSVSCVTTLLLVEGILKRRPRHWKTGAHFLINMVPTGLLLTLMLFENQARYYFLYGTAIAALNALSLLLLYKRYPHHHTQPLT